MREPIVVMGEPIAACTQPPVVGQRAGTEQPPKRLKRAGSFDSLIHDITTDSMETSAVSPKRHASGKRKLLNVKRTKTHGKSQTSLYVPPATSPTEGDCPYCGLPCDGLSQSITCDLCEGSFHLNCCGIDTDILPTITNLSSLM